MMPDSLTEPPGENGEPIERWRRRLIIGFALIAVAFGAMQAWVARFAMNPDGIQYLDNAAAWARGDVTNALNSLWSPLYPWLIAGLFRVTTPTQFQEFPIVHLLNFLIYLLSLGAFLFFLSAMRPMVTQSWHRFCLALIICPAFLYSSLDLETLTYVTPDLLVGLFAFLAAGILVRIANGRSTVGDFLRLGVVLGLGYLAKSPFLIYGVAGLAIAAILGRRRLGRVALACAGFAVVVVPYVWALSNAKGRLTFGDSGRLNVLWHVNGVPAYNWQGGPSGLGAPVHSTHQLSADPGVYEFAAPISGTYPPWYDPSYWYEGARVALRPADFARAIRRELGVYGYLIHHRQLALVFALLALVVLASSRRRALAEISKLWPILLFAALPFAMYALVHAEGRYLAPFFVLLWTGSFAGSLNALADFPSRRVVFAISAIAALLMLIESSASLRPETPIGPHYAVARALQDLGLKPGDRVAIASEDLDYYWAYLDGARVTMQIDFGSSPCPNCGRRREQWEKAKPILAANGVAFVVAPCLAGVVDQPGWRPLGDTGTFAYRVR